MPPVGGVAAAVQGGAGGMPAMPAFATDSAGFNPGVGLDAGGGGAVDGTVSTIDVAAPAGDVRAPGVDLGAPIAYGGDLSPG